MPEACAGRLLPGDPGAGVHVLRAAEAEVHPYVAKADAARHELLPTDEGVPTGANSGKESGTEGGGRGMRGRNDCAGEAAEL